MLHLRSGISVARPIGRTHEYAGVSEFIRTALPIVPAYLLFIFHANIYGNWLIDDAGISFAYARNLAQGIGLVAQIGSPPVEGFSNPLWTLLISVLYRFDLFSIPFTPKLLSLVLTFLTFLVCSTIVRVIVRSSRWWIASALTASFCSANPGFVIWNISGLENPLFAFLGTSLLLVCVWHSMAEPGKLLPLLAGLLSALLALTRPDGILYSAAFPILTFCLNKQGHWSRPVLTNILGYVASFTTISGGYLLFRLAYFDTWLPNTYFAKPGTSITALYDLILMSGSGTTKLIELSTGAFPFAPIIPLLIIISAILIPRSFCSIVPAIQIRITAGFTFIAEIAYVLLPNDWMGEFRFGTLALLFSYLLLSLATLSAGNRIKSTIVRQTLTAGLCLGLLMLCYQDYRFRAETFARTPLAPLSGVIDEAKRWHTVAKVIDLENGTLLAPDLGGLLHSKLRIVDLAGLCDREIAQLIHQRSGTRQLADHVMKNIRPDFIHLHGPWVSFSGLIRHESFSETYVHLATGHYVRKALLPDNADVSELAEIFSSRRQQGGAESYHF